MQSTLVFHRTSAPFLPRFSLVQGGPLFRLYRRLHLSGEDLEWPARRVLGFTLFAWLPLLLLSLVENRALAGTVAIPFLSDIETQAKLLVALPALIIAEPLLHLRLEPLLHRLVKRGIIVKKDLPKLSAAITSAIRVRDSVVLELILVVLVYTLGTWVWRSQHILDVATWYASPGQPSFHFTFAGYWNLFVSNAIFQILLLRWYVRLAIWFRLLWQISQMNLHLTAAHPDRAGGIGFLGRSAFAFGLILFAQGVLTAGIIANRVLLQGQSLLSFKLEAFGYVMFYVLMILAPLLAFSPRLVRARRKGKDQYGSLANKYVFGFEKKWIYGGAAETGQILGTSDLQSLADLANSYAVVHSMRFFPFALEDVLKLTIIAAVPLLPLALTIMPLETLLAGLLKILLR